MFWETFNTPCEINEDSTLDSILDDDYILQRCRERNDKLINFLLKSDVINKMIDMITDQSNIVFDRNRFKRPSVAAEILSSDIPDLLNYLVSSGKNLQSDSLEFISVESLKEQTEDTSTMPFLDNILSFVNTKLALNPLSASFFSKIMINLFANRSVELVPYLKKSPNFLSNLLQHIGTSSICDLLVELAQQNNSEQHVIAQWFIDMNIIEKLLDGLSPNKSKSCNEYSARCLIEFLSIYRNYVVCNYPDHNTDLGIDTPCDSENSTTFATDEEKAMYIVALKFLDILESKNTLIKLMDLIVNGSTLNPSTISNSVDVFLSIIEKTKSLNGLPPGSGDEFNETPFESLAAGLLCVPLPNRQFTNRLSTKSNCPILQERARTCETLAVSVAIPYLQKLYTVLQTCTVHNLDPILSAPLGKGKLLVVNFVFGLCQLNYQTMRQAICDAGFLSCFMNLFETFPFNSFLHKAVTDTIKLLLAVVEPEAKKTLSNKHETGEEQKESCNGIDVEEENTFALHLIQDCNLIDWILRLSCIPADRFTDGDRLKVCSLSTKSPKPGYSGHLWQIANAVVSRFPTVEDIPLKNGMSVECFSKWNEFIHDDLSAINDIQTDKSDIEMDNSLGSGSISFSNLQMNSHTALPDMKEMIRLLRGSSGHDFSSLSSDFSLNPIIDRTSVNGHPIELVQFPSSCDIFDTTKLDEEMEKEDFNRWSVLGNTSYDQNYNDEADVDDDENEIEPNVSSSDDDEEDLQSPAYIRQHRSDQQILLNPVIAAFAQLQSDRQIKTPSPVNTSIEPWATPGPSSAHQITCSSGGDSWANFETDTGNLTMEKSSDVANVTTMELTIDNEAGNSE